MTLRGSYKVAQAKEDCCTTKHWQAKSVRYLKRLGRTVDFASRIARSSCCSKLQPFSRTSKILHRHRTPQWSTSSSWRARASWQRLQRRQRQRRERQRQRHQGWPSSPEEAKSERTKTVSHNSH